MGDDPAGRARRFMRDRADPRDCSSLHAPLQGSGSQQCPLLGVLWWVFLRLAGLTWVLGEMHVSNFLVFFLKTITIGFLGQKALVSFLH